VDPCQNSNWMIFCLNASNAGVNLKPYLHFFAGPEAPLQQNRTKLTGQGFFKVLALRMHGVKL